MKCIGLPRLMFLSLLILAVAMALLAQRPSTIPGAEQGRQTMKRAGQSVDQDRLAPRSPLELCLLPPVFLDYYLNDKGGYDLPRLPKRPWTAAIAGESIAFALVGTAQVAVTLSQRAVLQEVKNGARR